MKKRINEAMDVSMEPVEALTGFLDLPQMGRIRLDFLITPESDAFYIRVCV